jgi:hypothetical protein
MDDNDFDRAVAALVGDERPLTDAGNAERLVGRHGDVIRFAHGPGKWLVWDGEAWVFDAMEEVVGKAIETVRRIGLD